MTVVIVESMSAADVPDVCSRVCDAVASDAVVDCDVSGIHDADVGTVDSLARIGLAARRAGGRIRLLGPSPALCELVEFAGLSDALGLPRATRASQASRRAGTSARCRGRT